MNASLNCFGIVVSDMSKSLAFYRYLGVDIPSEADQQRHVEAMLEGGLRLLFDTVETIHSFDPSWTEPHGSARIAIGFEFDTLADVDHAYSELTSQGYHGHKEPWNAFWGQRYAIMHDPDGNAIDLFAQL